jgi:glyoxylase-like metal-dependent hydrolase (beta-lactamase superfamily II)
MLDRKPIFPNVIELNFQAGHMIGCNVYLVFDGDQWALIDIGYEDSVDEIIELVRQLDFPLANCVSLVATHADVDHGQGFAKAKQMLKTQLAAHPKAADLLRRGDRLQTFAEIEAQGLSMAMPKVETDREVNNGDAIGVGSLELEVWSTPGHADSQLAFRMGKLLFSGDNIYRDGCVGAIDAHHGSDIPDFIQSLERIRDADLEWLLPSHGPYFKHDPVMIQKTIDRLQTYTHMADFGTCAVDWPLMDEWEDEIAEGKLPE